MIDENEKVYQRCLDYERNREWYRRQTDQGKFEASYLHLDHRPFDCEEYVSFFNDGGKGVDAVIAELDRDLERVIINGARHMVEAAMPWALSVFDAIRVNGNDTDGSIRWLVDERKSENRRTHRL